MTTPKSPEAHGTECTCGVDVRSFTRLLDTATLAAHLGVPVGSLKAYVVYARATEGRPAPSWFVSPDVVLGKALLWDITTAERMRVARQDAVS